MCPNRRRAPVGLSERSDETGGRSSNVTFFPHNAHTALPHERRLPAAWAFAVATPAHCVAK